MIETTDLHAGSWTRARGMGRVATEHRDTGPKLRSAERNHVFPMHKKVSNIIPSRTNSKCPIPDMVGNDFTVVSGGIHQNPLNEVVAILIPCDCFRSAYCLMEKIACVEPTINQWHPRSISATSANLREIAIQEL